MVEILSKAYRFKVKVENKVDPNSKKATPKLLQFDTDPTYIPVDQLKPLKGYK